LDDALIVRGDFGESSGAAGMQALLPKSPDAVFVASDTMAIGALRVLRQAGLQVPKDVAVIGFDDIPASSVVEPLLTTVRQPIERMGSMAIEILLGVLANDTENGTAHRIILPTELVIRESCGSG
jgi:LacI family transcriptional regulator